MNQIITISREFGSGGRELGRRLSETLGIAYYDQEIITEIAKRTELDEDYVRQITENKPAAPYPIHIGVSFQRTVNEMFMQKVTVFREQCNLLKELAERSDCVIVGRCADVILAYLNPFRIFVFADQASKQSRCQARAPEHEKISQTEMERRMRRIDMNRARQHEMVAGIPWGAKDGYDLCINTSGKEIKSLIPAIANYAAGWFGEKG